MIVSIDVDAQKTFTPICPSELPVKEGDKIVDELNQQAKLANLRVMTKDAHCLKAAWICNTHDEMMQATGLEHADLTWVAHAIVGSEGFELLDGLPKPMDYDFCVWKGIEPDLHPYGACYHDLAEKHSTGLVEWLSHKKTKIILLGGLATDYCVKTTVLQLLRAGDWQVIVNQAACRGIAEDTVCKAWQEMENAGALILKNSAAIADYLANK